MNISQQNGSHIIRDKEIEISTPSCSWFDRNTIHSIEKKLLPEIFNENSYLYLSEDNYKNIRNQIIDLYNENSNSYLTLSSCYKISSIPVSGLLKYVKKLFFSLLFI